ncbi:ArnT family glycosyltransferase [Geobacter sulfurreducens]|uniref:ArnT family glycosyltransferase n=1 Tax=Geobacter sulfurreducens TaxID=35554 RepID=UPI000DBB5814|nr:glycosyltransferase family 39 protein [Geobacter sulfurreducens]BBA70984.1 Undecaprenyl phosphate-alpha-4-amino-4-deoxy-L-arabinose arabinosyl transferase [Geobacter sulfurreducens]
MRLSRRALPFLAIYFLILLYPGSALHLRESTEARYGEIAREMVVTGNWLEPHLNGIKHFHKPPLSMWGMAAGMELFGINGFGVRFFGIVAATAALAALLGTARIFLGSGDEAINAMLICGTSLLFLSSSRVVSTDIYLACFTALAQLMLFRQLYGGRSFWNAPLYGLFLGLGFLTKGPIILLFTLLPFMVAKTFDRDHRNVFTWREVAAAAGVFAAVALPWYLAVSISNPELPDYFLKVQTVDRVATNRFGRDKPFWYFFVIFSATFFPYTLFLARGVAGWKQLDGRIRTIFVYIVAPLVVFSLAKSKLSAYILPFYGTASIITAYALARFETARLRAATLVILTLAAVAAGGTGFFYKPAAPLKIQLLLYGVALLVLCAYLWKSRLSPQFVRNTALYTLCLSVTIYSAMTHLGPYLKGYGDMVAAIDRIDPERKRDILMYGTFIPSLSFYRNRIAAMGLVTDRDLRFEEDGANRDIYLPTDADVERFLAARGEIFVVTDQGQMDQFRLKHACSVTPVFVQRKHTAYLCRREPPPPPAP